MTLFTINLLNVLCVKVMLKTTYGTHFTMMTNGRQNSWLYRNNIIKHDYSPPQQSGNYKAANTDVNADANDHIPTYWI